MKKNSYSYDELINCGEGKLFGPGDAMWQLVGFYLGWIGNPGKGRALGVGTVKFTGEVLQNVKLVTYEIDMKKIMSPGGTTVGLANGVVLADGKKIYSADSLKVGLFK